jgi:hypothetical protein
MSILKPTTKRINLSVPREYHANLQYVSKRLGVSASALLYQISGGSLVHMADLLKQVPADADDKSIVKRLRGESIAYIEDRYAELKIALSDLDSRLESNGY